MKSLYRSLAGKLLWVQKDYVDASYDLKELARQVSSPRESQLAHAKHLVRYLKGHSDTLLKMKPSPVDVGVHTYVDRWAGCQETAKSTDSVVSFVAGCLVTFSSRTGTTVSQSSAEAELEAELGAIHGAINSVFLAKIWEEMTGDCLKIHAYSDSSAGRAIACRRGLRRARHLSDSFSSSS